MKKFITKFAKAIEKEKKRVMQENKKEVQKGIHNQIRR